MEGRRLQPWEAHWEIVSRKGHVGGQGIVRKVRSKTDGSVGALKTLHQDHQPDTERRFRMQQEVNALHAIGSAVAQVFDSNVEQWRDKDVPLYVVMEWIPGPTLAEQLSSSLMTLDHALACTQSVLFTLEKSHGLGIFHRDLKPDNIILREGNPLDPVLIDFGIAWAKAGDAPRPFDTDRGQEMGNRFLRLPENAPGRISRDARSDVTLVAGLLLFVLSGFSPRVLRNEHGQLPHEAGADQIPQSIREDTRWARLRRVFQRAFQTELELRYQSVSDLRDALNSLEPSAEVGDVIGPALERLRNLIDSERVQRFHRIQEMIQKECTAFVELVSRLGDQAGFGMPGSHGFTEDGQVYQVGFGLQRRGTSGGTAVWYRHEVHIGETEFWARYQVGQSPYWNEYYRGSIADPEGLREAMTRQAPVLIAELIDEYTSRLKGLDNGP